MTKTCSSGFILKYVILQLVVIVMLVNGNVVRLDLDEEDRHNIILDDDRVTVPVVMKTSSRQTLVRRLHSTHKRPVKHFAVHGICRSRTGRRRLYLAFKSKLCHIRDLFISNLVRHLCRQGGRSLTNWISELFDVDRDGYITHYERYQYG